MRICEPGGQGVVTARIFIGVGVLAIALLVGGCANQQSASGLPRGSDGCTNSGFLVNPQYTRSNGQMGPPFPFYRHVFCAFGTRATYSFEMSDARKRVHAIFALEFRGFQRTGQRATGTYVRSTFQAITDFAEGNALGKWLNCRDMIRSREEFTIDDCFEIDGDFVMRIGPGRPGGQAGEYFPCGINVGPVDVRDYEGDEVPAGIYGGEWGSLTGGLSEGDRVAFETQGGLNGVYVPEIFLGDIGFSMELPRCGG